MTGKGNKTPLAIIIAAVFVCGTVLVATGTVDIGALLNNGGQDTGTNSETQQTTPSTGANTNTNINLNTGSTGTAVTNKVPVESLKVTLKNKFTEAAITAGRVEVWTKGADVSDPNSAYLEMAVPASGVADLTGYTIQHPSSDADYDVWYSDNSSSTYYDAMLKNWAVNYNPDTGKGVMLINGKNYFSVIPVGAFVDVDSLPELSSSSVWNESATDISSADAIAYDESAGAGSAWFYMDIGNANANSELQNVVLCLMDDDGDMDGDEVTGLTVSKVSGSAAITIPGDLLGYWQDGMGSGGKRCFTVSNNVGSGETNRYKFLWTFNEDNFATTEEFELCQDDLGDYSAKQYPAKDSKATAECLTIGDQA